MTWTDWHRQSEILASDAALLSRAGRLDEASALRLRAAELEERALAGIDPAKARTLGIIAVSAVSLWFKAGEYRQAARLVHSVLAQASLPKFAERQLQDLLQAIWAEDARRKAEVAFLPGQVLVSVEGGEIVTGGAPLDLIVDRVQTIQALFYRTIELLKGLPHRQRGGPGRDIRDSCRPWLFQAPPGSYQFSVVLQEPAQKDFFRDSIKPNQIANHFLQIVKATTEDGIEALAEIVPDCEYRTTFLKLSRNLAPASNTFNRIVLRSADESMPVTLDLDRRAAINRTLRNHAKPAAEDNNQEITISGTLRALHLDGDWIEIAKKNGITVRVDGLKDTVDDVIGPMVNRLVIVRAVESTGNKSLFVDIELDE